MPDRQDSAGDRRQRALVTGAMSGLGRAIAQQLARDGMDVIVHGRDASRGIQTVVGIERDGGRASFAAAEQEAPDVASHALPQRPGPSS